MKESLLKLKTIILSHKVIAGALALAVVGGTVGTVAYVNYRPDVPAEETVETEEMVEEPVQEELTFTDIDADMYATLDGVIVDNPTDRNTIKKFVKNELLKVTGENDAWYRVAVDDKTGVVRKGSLTSKAPVIETETTATASSDKAVESTTAKTDTKKSSSSSTATSKSKTTTSSGNVDNAAPTTNPSVETQPSTPSTPDTPSTPSAPTAEEQAQIAAWEQAMAETHAAAEQGEAEAAAAREAYLAEHPEMAAYMPPANP